MTPAILRYGAFTTDPAGGNPAGVVLDARGLDAAAMQRIAADVGYSETAFLSPRADGDLDVRYFSPLAEVSFCGHATIAAMVAQARVHGPGDVVLHTQAGRVPVTVDAGFAATLTSVPPRTAPIDAADLDALLATLGWRHDELDAALSPGLAYAGAWHPVIAAASRARLADLYYDFDALAALMKARGWTTINLVWRADAQTLHARNPFPPGGVVEDSATGAAAAALGAYLASHDLLPASRAFTIHQGHDIGRPSLLEVEVPHDVRDGVRVSGTAVEIVAG
ncbi:PhzF family phenazine biosynthesis isomerase [Pseudoxanthomonas sp.]|uniref:PhzF family phenazine biosynthesis protein n=1 Tax=Pseudoxanthomonas sp. TaxID=1871049 RepID=UPI0028C3B626|nr:PhzF family phenazine biosynthesis isomerase [Pseudoxanthomonas sp.]